MIRQASVSDSDQITKIYNNYVVNTLITFEEEQVDVSEMELRIQRMSDKGFPYLVWEEDGKVWKVRYTSSSVTLVKALEKSYTNH
jgi:phosphinothricin acetyltransferase